MDIILRYIFMATQYLAIVLIIGEIIYVTYQKPSKYQTNFILLLCSTLIMLIGYTIELYSNNIEVSIVAAAISYIGKPFSMLTSFLFISNYCGYKISKKISVPLALYGIVFPVLVFTNGVGGETDPGHHLYYATAYFKSDSAFSPMVITHGPLYYSYMIFLVALFVADVIMIFIASKKAKTKERKAQVLLLFCVISSAILGYIIYLTGITGGYDTTMTGTSFGVFFLTIVFFKYRLFDSLTSAKEHALENAQNGLLVFDEKGKVAYTNNMIDRLLKSSFNLYELSTLDNGEHVVTKNDKVYDVSVTNIFKAGFDLGRTIEISDITVKHNYRKNLEHDVMERTQEIKNIQRQIIAAFSGIVEARDNSTGTHINRMSNYVKFIAEELYKNGDYPNIVDEEYITKIFEISPLHDVGKITVPDNVLQKPGKLTPEEFDIIKTHAAEGAKIITECLEGVESPEYVQIAKNIANYHHEKWNGTGYPEGLSGNKIPLCARIVSVADVYDAVRSERCYKPPMDLETSKQIIIDGSGTQFDPIVVNAFLRALPKIESFQD